MKKGFWAPEHLANSLSSSCVQGVCLVSFAQTPFKLSYPVGSILAEIDQPTKDDVPYS